MPQCPNFSILTFRALIILPRMGFINSFGQAGQEILLNNYLNSNFENAEVRDVARAFWNFIRVKFFLKKSRLFQTLNANISRTAYDREINEPILIFPLKDFHMKVV